MTLTSWLDVSEQCFGLILVGEEPVTNYAADMFQPPYDKGFINWKEFGNQTKLTKEIGTAALNSALAAAETVVSGNEVEWPVLLKEKANYFMAGVAAEKLGKRLREGRAVDTTQLLELATAIKGLANPEHLGLTDLGDVDITEWKPFKETGWPALDETVGGICAHRPTAVGANTGRGKSMWTIQFLQYYLNRWPEEKVAVYSLEMSKEAWKYRVVQLFPEMMKWFNTGRLLVSDRSVSPNDVSLEVAATGCDLVIIDYINYLVRGEITPQSLEVVNRGLNEMCRTLHVPTIILHQFNSQRREPVPKESHFYMGTSSANVAGMLIGLSWLKNAEEAGEEFTYDEDNDMMISILKSGDGFKNNAGPGAAFMPRTKNLWGSPTYVWQQAGQKSKRLGKKAR